MHELLPARAAVAAVGDLGRALRQGWRPVRGTRQRGFSAAPSPAPQGRRPDPHLGPLVRREFNHSCKHSRLFLLAP